MISRAASISQILSFIFIILMLWYNSGKTMLQCSLIKKCTEQLWQIMSWNPLKGEVSQDIKWLRVINRYFSLQRPEDKRGAGKISDTVCS